MTESQSHDRMVRMILFAALILISCSTRGYAQSYNANSFSTYIVREPPGGKPAQFATRRDWHLSILASVADPNVTGIPVEQRLLYTYDTVFPGFAAILNYAEWRHMFALAGGAIFADDVATTQTTRTPTFLGLTSGRRYSAGGQLWTAANRGSDVIVGVLDTGIWPERRSFSGRGYGAAPARWKGSCHASVPCNGKIVGSRAFLTGYDYSAGYGYPGQLNETLESRSPRDTVGHGTHTASVIGGNPVANASLLGAAAGTATGMAPLARLAIYKVCWDPEGLSCHTSDILAGFDAAIADGVDLISIPIATYSWEYQSNPISLGAFAAGLRGIATIAPASNNGLGTNGGVQNQAPWVLTVGASTVDRTFTAPVILGDGRRFWGQTLYAGAGPGSGRDQVSVVYAGSRSSLASGIPPEYAWQAAYCTNPNIYSREELVGKVVLCQMGEGDNFVKSRALKAVGAVGMIVMQYYSNDTTAAIEFGPPLLPTTLVTYATGQAIVEYVNQSFDPTVAIDFQGTVVGATPAPAVAAFSGKGPNAVTAEVLKPDFVAPGVNILGTYTGFCGPAGKDDDRRVDFNVMSGTSVASAHAAGVAALLKAVHPAWSPAAIRSAIMTSAATLDNTGRPISDVNTNRPATALAMGAGQIRPNSALNPGIVYDIDPADYLHFLCSQNYSTAAIYTFLAVQIASNFSCESSPRMRPGDLNHPAFGVVYNQARLPPDSLFTATFSRVVTNVGPSVANYSVSVVTPGSDVNVTVDPPELRFTAAGQRLTYSVTFQARPLEFSAEFSNVRVFTFGSVTWTDQIRNTSARSPILFIWVYG